MAPCLTPFCTWNLFENLPFHLKSQYWLLKSAIHELNLILLFYSLQNEHQIASWSKMCFFWQNDKWHVYCRLYWMCIYGFHGAMTWVFSTQTSFAMGRFTMKYRSPWRNYDTKIFHHGRCLATKSKSTWWKFNTQSNSPWNLIHH